MDDFLWIFALALAAVAFAVWRLQRRPEVEEISAQEAAQLVQQGAAFLDVRQPSEFAQGAARGARLVPLGRLEAGLEGVARERPVVLICASGSRSAAAAARLKAMGFARPLSVRGGLSAWRAAGLPTNTPDKDVQ